MKKMKQVGIAAIAVVAACALAACGGGSGSNGSSGASDNNGKAPKIKAADYLKAKYADLQQGKTLTMGIVEIPAQGNPFHQDASAYASTLWYWYNPQVILFDEEGKAYPNKEFLESMKEEVKDNKTIVTYKLNPKAHFNNGDPFTWKSWEATWKINNGKSKDYSPNSTDGYEHIESVKQGANEHEAIVTFDRVYPWWQGLFNMVAHPKLVDKDFYQNGYLKKAHPELGAGPYKLDQIDFNNGTAVFVPNEKWWGRKGKLSRITFKQLETSAAINAFRNGEIDVIGASTKETQSKIAGMTGITYYTSFYPGNSLLMLNAKAPALGESKVREAIFTALDRSKLSQIRFNDVKVADAKGQLTIPYKEELPGSFLLFPVQNGYENNFAAAVKYDPKHAMQLLDEAGWKKGKNGIREKDGKPLSIRYVLLGDAEISKGLAKAYQAMLKAVGIDMKIVNRPSKEFSQVYTKRDFDIFAMGFSSTDPYGVAYFGQIYGTDSGLNLSSTGTKAFDKKIEELQKLPTQEEQIKRGNELEKEAFKLYGIMPLFNGADVVATKKGLANYGAQGFTKIPREMVGWVK